jgi:ABC-type branched-subunit amino acid transport system substrate-binding protein
MRFFKPFFVVTLFLLAPSAFAEPQQLKIGVLLSLTGDAASWGVPALNAVRLATDEINEAGKLHITLEIEDNKSSALQAVTNYHLLTEQKNVDALIGDVWAYLTNPLVPLTLRTKKLLVSPTVVDTSVETKSEYFFTLGPKIENTKNALLFFFDHNQDIHTAATTCWDDPWGQAILSVWREVLAEKKLPQGAELCTIDYTNTFDIEALKLSKLKPDVVYVAHDLERVLPKLYNFNFHPKIIATDNMHHVLKNHLLPNKMLEGVAIVDWEQDLQFVQAYKNKFNENPYFEAYASYDAVRSLAKAFQSNPNDPLSAFKALNFKGVAGEVNFTKSFAGNQAVATLKQIKNGEIVQWAEK